MTTLRVEKVGYCAHESKEGDWAFEMALELARRLNAPLHVFGFLLDPYQKIKPEKMVIPSVSEEELVRIEKALRFRYEEPAGDYVNVGFRLCHDNAWRELHRCLCRREFQVLVLANPSEDAYFLGEPIHQFLKLFICPTISVSVFRWSVFFAVVTRIDDRVGQMLTSDGFTPTENKCAFNDVF